MSHAAIFSEQRFISQSPSFNAQTSFSPIHTPVPLLAVLIAPFLAFHVYRFTVKMNNTFTVLVNKSQQRFLFLDYKATYDIYSHFDYELLLLHDC